MKAIRRDVFFGLLLLIVLGGPFLFRAVVHFLDHRELLRERELAAAEGLPMTADALRPAKPVPDANNAAVEIRMAHDLIYKDRAKLGFSPSAITNARNYFNQKNESLFSSVRDGTTNPSSHFTVFRKPIELMLTASKRDQLDFHRPWENGAGVLFPELASIKMLVRVICARSIYADKVNDRSTARAHLLAAARICNLIRQEPSMFAAMVSVACEQIVLDALLKLQKASVDSKAWLLAATEIVGAMGPPIDVKFAFQSDVLMTTAFLDIFLKKDGPAYIGLTAADLRQHPIRFDLRDRTEIEVLRAYRELYRKLPSDRYDYLAYLEADKNTGDTIATNLVRFSKLFDYFIDSKDPGLGPLGNAALGAANGLVRRRLALAFAQAMLVRAKTGQFPKSLPVTGADAIDPFTGKPLIYWQFAGKMQIHSVGIDQTDNGGNSRLSPNGQHPYDIVAQYP